MVIENPQMAKTSASYKRRSSFWIQASPYACEAMTVRQQRLSSIDCIDAVRRCDIQADKSNGLKLPNLNAQQQQALQTIMNFGQLGSTKEGKKVRRYITHTDALVLSQSPTNGA